MSILKVNTIQDKGGNNLLASDGAGTISSGGLMTNTPSFFAQLSSDQSVTSATTTKAQVNQVSFDTDSCYDNSTNYRFTPTVAGKYFVYGSIQANGSVNSGLAYIMSNIYKNGISISQNLIDNRNNYGGTSSASYTSVIVDMNGSTDYLELYGIHNASSGTAGFDGSTATARTYFGAYRIIGA